jgi:hypothetical protein
MSDSLAQAKALSVLLAAGYRDPKAWPYVCIVIESLAAPFVESRGSLAARLRISGLDTLAKQCILHVVKPGYVLVYAALESDLFSGAGFQIFNLRKTV